MQAPAASPWQAEAESPWQEADADWPRRTAALRAAGLYRDGPGKALWSFGVSPPVPTAGGRPDNAPACHSSVSFPAWAPFADECHTCRLQLTVGYRRGMNADGDHRDRGCRLPQTGSGDVAFAIKFETPTTGRSSDRDSYEASVLALTICAEDGAPLLHGHVTGRPQCLTHVGHVRVADVPSLPSSRVLQVRLERIPDGALLCPTPEA